jgi:hypothetical protein
VIDSNNVADFLLDYKSTTALHKHINQVSELNISEICITQKHITIDSNMSTLKEDVNIVDMETFFITSAHPDLT